MSRIWGTLVLSLSLSLLGGTSFAQEPKGKMDPMYYVLEEKDGAYKIVFYNTPIGKTYDFPISNLNGIVARSTPDKKHYISVGSFEGKIESVHWNKDKVPSKTELESKKK